MLKLLSYNIRYGGSGRIENLATVIKACAPDLVIFQEATKPNIIEQLSKLTGLRYWASQPGYSLGFMSRVAVTQYQWHRPPGARHPYLEIVPENTDMRFFGVHLSAIHSNWTEARRVRELRAVLKDIERFQKHFHVLAGDFNTLGPGELLDVNRLPFRLRPLVWLSGGNVRWQAIQVMLDTEYIDGYRAIHPKESGFTFPTWGAHLRLDYIFVPITYLDRLKACEVIDKIPQVAQASDHFPILAQLEVA